MTYSDFPECLPRYAWLLDDAGRDLSRMFHGANICKVCGATVAPADHARHRRAHISQLRRAADLRKRAAVARLKQTTRLRAEQRRLTA